MFILPLFSLLETLCNYINIELQQIFVFGQYSFCAWCILLCAIFEVLYDKWYILPLYFVYGSWYCQFDPFTFIPRFPYILYDIIESSECIVSSHLLTPPLVYIFIALFSHATINRPCTSHIFCQSQCVWLCVLCGEAFGLNTMGEKRNFVIWTLTNQKAMALWIWFVPQASLANCIVCSYFFSYMFMFSKPMLLLLLKVHHL